MENNKAKKEKPVKLIKPKKKPNKYKYSEVEKNRIFKEEFYIHSTALYGYALKLTKDTDAASDLVQDTFANTFEKMYQYEAGTNAKAWLSRAMFNHFINLTKKKVNFIELDYVPASKQLNPERGLNGLGDEYLELLAILDERERVPFVMAYIELYQYHEIADMLDIVDGTIRTQIHRAKEKLKKYIKNKTDKENGSIL